MKARELKIDDSSEEFEKTAGQDGEHSTGSVSNKISNASANQEPAELGSGPIFEEQNRLFLSTFLSAHVTMKAVALVESNTCSFVM